MKTKDTRIKGVNGGIPLPEEVIQHIQSFMNAKEAPRSTVLSKSWYNAWLTRPTIDLDYNYFFKREGEWQDKFGEFMTKTMQRYLDLSLNIESFRLSCSYFLKSKIKRKLIVSAMKMGATTVKLELSRAFKLPQELFGSKTLLKLSLISCKIDENYIMSCSRLKSLTLEHVIIKRIDVFKDIIACCVSMEELSLFECSGMTLSSMNLYELQKLRCLTLRKVDADSTFFTNFASRFPCLKDLIISECRGYKNIQIASTSIETIIFVMVRGSERATFDVPNIRKFIYSGSGLPSHLSINGASKEWEFQLHIVCKRLHKTSWFMNLKKLLKKFRLSRISLYISFTSTFRYWTPEPEPEPEHEVDVEAVSDPLVVENLMIEAATKSRSALLVSSFGAFRPKFITHPGWMVDKEKSVDTLYERLLQLLFISNWQEKFGQFGLKEVNMEIYDEFDPEWRPVELKKPMADSKAKVRLPLIWED